MKLYLVHCGFYDSIAGDGIYELHTNLFVLAESFEEAKEKAKLLPEFKSRKMHVDGMQEIVQVDGREITFGNKKTDQKTVINSKRSSFARIPKPAVPQ
ncbi:MAG: hypothetical protein EOP09_01185 [Proteobacteria bacterium]|nr:MAG: hypothetical protein EOP09_01185 [Pseudomonadota bacterium]